MKKSILKKFRHDYEPNCDENNNSTTMDDHYGTFQNGVLLSSTVSNDFKFLDLVINCNASKPTFRFQFQFQFLFFKG